MSTTFNPSTAPLAAQQSGTEAKALAGIDPRGPQFAASLTAVVLVAVLLLPPMLVMAVESPHATSARVVSQAHRFGPRSLFATAGR